MTKKQLPAPALLSKARHNLPALVLLLIGFIVGVLWLGAVRYFTVQPEETHYHANFGVFIDGKREEFKSFTYYEEIAACSTAFADNPKGRTHMHDQVNDVIHVHDKAVTYADFFASLDWTLGPTFVRTADGLVQNTNEKSWAFILNGQRISRPDTVVIGDKDKLLVSYGTADTDFSAQYNQIANTAEEVDAKSDPATCSGLNGPHDNSFPARLKRAFAS